MHRAALAGRPGPSAGHRPRRMGAGEHRVVPAADPPDHGSARGADARTRRAAARVEGGGRRGRHVARLDVGPRARSVRPARRRRQPGRPRPRLLRRPERARAREAIRVPASRVPAVARAPRGHPPRAVHRRPVDARATTCRSSRRRCGRSIPIPKRFVDAIAARPRPARGRVRTRSTTAAWWRCWPRPSSARCSTRSAA